MKALDTCLDTLGKLFLSPMEVLLFLIFLTSIWLIWKAQKVASEVKLQDLILGPDNKASWSKIAAIIGFVIGSWVVVYLTLHDKLTEMYFLFYFAICVGSPVAFAIVNRVNDRDKPEGQ